MSKDLLTLAHEIDGHLRLIQQVLRQPMQSEISKHGLTGPQVNVIEAVFRRPGMSLKELSQAVGLAHSTTSGIVDRLESRGILQRTVDGDDSRISRIHLCKAVLDYVENIMPARRRHPLMQALEKIKPAKREELAQSLRLLRKVMEED